MTCLRNVKPTKFEHRMLVCSRFPAKFSDDPNIERVKSFGDLLSLPFAPLYPFLLWLRSWRAQVVILHAPFPLADLVYGLGLRRRGKLVVYWHSEIVRQKVWAYVLGPLIDRTLLHAAAIIVSDQSIVDGTVALSRHSGKCVVAPFPVDVMRFELTAAERLMANELRRRYPRLLVACGRLVRYKGFDILIKAAADLDDAHVIIIGDGPERARLQAQIDDSNLAKRVFLVGAIPERELACYLDAASVFVMPSISKAETFGIAQLEAMAAGCAIVNTSIPTAVPEVARHGIEALTVPPGDYKRLAEALRCLLDNDSMRVQLGKSAKARARECFSRERYEETVENLLDMLVGDHATH